MNYYPRIALISFALAALTLAVIVFAPRPEDVLVVDQAPWDDRVALDSPIFVTFSKMPEKRSAEWAFTLTPVVKGRFEWQEQTLIFRPRELLNSRTRYYVRIRPGLRDMRGHINQTEVQWSFQTR